MYAELNSRVKLSDLIQGVIIQSANDACIAIAEGMAGSETVFAEQMTQACARSSVSKKRFSKTPRGFQIPNI